MALPPTHAPAWQESVWVHALASLQVAPSAFAGFVHTPDAGLHTPASWHWSWAVHVTGVPATHTPAALQVSAPLHALPSAQDVPAAALTCEHVPLALQLSVVHGLL